MTTPTREQECKHKHIKTWVFEDTKEPAMWSCADCGMKFAPEMATLTAGRDQGLREAKEAFDLSEHMHKRNTGLMLCISDLGAVIVRMAAGIDHLSEIARQWEPDHSSGAERRGWVLAKDARDDALKLLKEHAAAIEQLMGE